MLIGVGGGGGRETEVLGYWEKWQKEETGVRGGGSEGT